MYYRFDQVFETRQYPAGEKHIILTGDVGIGDIIEVRARTFTDLANVIVADRIFRHNGVRVTWFIPYLPFARDDRRNTRADGMELTLAIEMLRVVDCVIADPHSDVSGVLDHFPQSECVARFIERGLLDTEKEPVIVIPDAGATKKAYTWMDQTPNSFVQCNKTRDPQTGALSGFRVDDDYELEGTDCIIVDDICDGGGTFLALADILRERGAKTLTLAVTHGLFTKGIPLMLSSFDHIFYFNDRDISTPNVITVPWSELFTKGTPV